MSSVRLGIAIAVVLAALLATTRSASSSTATTALRLDGSPVQPELALTYEQRQRGLMARRTVPADGMLFVFPQASSGGFWMKNTLVPLRIVFFDSRGKAVRTMAMTPCRADPCRIYDPGRQYRFALELRATDSRAAKRLGPQARLTALIRASS